MFKKNLLIGTLVAGAFVLPSLAAAGVVTGVCSNCHTMHNSQNGVDAGVENGNLLTGTGCQGCHADGTSVNNTTTGQSNAATLAPQVTGTAGGINTAGYFDNAAADNTHHNVNEVVSGSAWENADAGMAGNIPGSAVAYAGYTLTCQGCHTTAGHHAGGGNYRMLANAAATASPNDYNPNAAGVFPGNRAAVAYNGANMNAVCAGCHANFHDAGTGGGANTGGPAVWTRHPTNISITAAGPSIDGAAVSTDAVPMGDGGTKTVLCLSCHVAHGGPNADLLAFSYAGNVAGGTARGTGCETCHSYAGNGM